MTVALPLVTWLSEGAANAEVAQSAMRVVICLMYCSLVFLLCLLLPILYRVLGVVGCYKRGAVQLLSPFSDFLTSLFSGIACIDAYITYNIHVGEFMNDIIIGTYMSILKLLTSRENISTTLSVAALVISAMLWFRLSAVEADVTEVKADIQVLREETKADIQALREETKADITEVKAGIQVLREEQKLIYKR